MRRDGAGEVTRSKLAGGRARDEKREEESNEVEGARRGRGGEGKGLSPEPYLWRSGGVETKGIGSVKGGGGGKEKGYREGEGRGGEEDGKGVRYGEDE